MTKPLSNLKPVVNFLIETRKVKITAALVSTETNLEHKSVLRIMRKLTEQGYLELIDEGILHGNKKGGVNSKNPTWKIVDKKALPQVLKPKKKKGIRDRLWKAIRIKRIFSVTEIMKLASAKEATVMTYIKILERNKLVRKSGKRVQREESYWQLIRDDGPDRPALNEYPEVPNG